jgi:hypothetical protein
MGGIWWVLEAKLTVKCRSGDEDKENAPPGKKRKL